MGLCSGGLLLPPLLGPASSGHRWQDQQGGVRSAACWLLLPPAHHRLGRPKAPGEAAVAEVEAVEVVAVPRRRQSCRRSSTGWMMGRSVSSSPVARRGCSRRATLLSMEEPWPRCVRVQPRCLPTHQDRAEVPIEIVVWRWTYGDSLWHAVRCTVARPTASWCRCWTRRAI